MSILITTPHGQVKLGTVSAPHSSGTASISSSTSTNCIEKRNINHAEPCFITNEFSYINKQVHWIKAIEGNDEKDKEMKFEIAQFLLWQGIVGKTFTLDHPSNLTNINSGLHSAMDEYEMFVVTCTHATLDALIKIIRKENELALKKAGKGAGYIRNLEIWTISETAEYEAVILRPKHFLPKGSCLARYLTQNSADMPKLYQVNSNGVLCEAPLTASSPCYPPFRFVGNCNRGDKLNPYLVILAAEIKFRQYQASSDAPQLDAKYEALITKTIEIANLLYWEPIAGVNAKLFFPPEASKTMDIDNGLDGQATHDSGMGFQGDAHDAGGSMTWPPISGEGTRKPGFDWRPLLSGRDLPLDSDDQDLLQEMSLSNRCSKMGGVDVSSWRQSIAAKRVV